MRVIVTGGTGMIGRALTAELADAGNEVVVTSRDPGRTTGLPTGTQVVEWDARSAEALRPLLEGSHAVVHLLGENIAGGRWTDERKRLIRESRLVSTAALTEALAGVEDRPAVLLQASAVGFYGSRGEESLDEDSSAGTGFLAQTCIDWERAGEPVEALGMRRIRLRSGVVLARAAGAFPRMVAPFRLFVGGPVGNGRQWVPWIHIADEVGAIAYLLKRSDAHGVFNLTAPTSITSRGLGKAIGQALGRPSLLPAPTFAMKLLLGEMSELVLGSQKVLPRGLIDADYEFRFPTVRAALRDLLARKEAR